MNPEAVKVIDHTPILCAKLAEYYTGAKRSRGVSEATNCSQMDMANTQNFKEYFTRLTVFEDVGELQSASALALAPESPESGDSSSIVIDVVQSLKDQNWEKKHIAKA